MADLSSLIEAMNRAAESGSTDEECAKRQRQVDCAIELAKVLERFEQKTGGDMLEILGNLMGLVVSVYRDECGIMEATMLITEVNSMMLHHLIHNPKIEKKSS